MMRILKRKGAFLWLVILAFALVIVLLPVREAKANYKDGDKCPNPMCAYYSLYTLFRSTKDHSVWCTVCHWVQKKKDDGYWETTYYEPHFGGVATCKDKAVCESCLTPYGKLDSNNHTNLETITAKDATCSEQGNNLYYYCNDCKKYLKADKKTVTTVKAETTQPLKHSWGAWTDVGDGVNHTRTCKRSGCGVTETAPHSGGTATCTNKAACKTCNTYYGNTAPIQTWQPSPRKRLPAASLGITCITIAWTAIIF